jgi:hypothetical protein
MGGGGRRGEAAALFDGFAAPAACLATVFVELGAGGEGAGAVLAAADGCVATAPAGRVAAWGRAAACERVARGGAPFASPV